MARKHRPYFHPVKLRWRVRIDSVEHWAPAGLGPDDESKAWAWMARLQAGPAPVASPRITLDAIRALYLQWLDGERQAGRMGQKTYQNSRTHLKMISGFQRLGRVPVASITPAHLAAFLDSIGRFSANYRRNIVKTLQAALNWAATPQVSRPALIERNPIRGVKRPSVPRRSRYVEPDAVRRFARHCWARARRERPDRKANGRNACWLMRFLHLTGARPGEACKMLWTDVKWDAGWIVLPPERHKTGRKSLEPRLIALTARVARLLRRVERLGVRPDGHVWGHSRGPWDSVAFAARIRRWRKEMGGSVRPYSLRHAYASEAISQGLSLSDLGKLLGNSAAILERHYDHAILGRLADQAREFERKRGKG